MDWERRGEWGKERGVKRVGGDSDARTVRVNKGETLLGGQCLASLTPTHRVTRGQNLNQYLTPVEGVSST